MSRSSMTLLFLRPTATSTNDLWGVIKQEEKDRQDREMANFGEKQVNRYLEQSKEATESEFTSSLYDNSNSNAQ